MLPGTQQCYLVRGSVTWYAAVLPGMRQCYLVCSSVGKQTNNADPGGKVTLYQGLSPTQGQQG